VKATTRLDVNHAVADLMGVRKLSFASAEETVSLTGMMIGGVTVFALHERLMSLDYVILGSGSRSSKVKTSPEVFLRLPQAKVIPGLALEPPPAG
jgi:prolyl-tRNA editing enzyme YbaK/EbsC (Cys-tRNA(Pro) deacylase)